VSEHPTASRTASPTNSRTDSRTDSRTTHRLRTTVAAAVVGITLGGVGAAYASTTSTTPAPGAPAPGGTSAGQAASRGPKGGHGHGQKGGGVISAVSSSALTYAGPAGTTRTAALNGSTTYTRDGQVARQSDLAVGQRVSVRLVDPAATSPVAASVDIHSPHLGGTVTSDGATTIVVTDPDGFHRTIHTSGATSYTDNGQSASSSAVVTGRRVNAIGSIDANGTDLDATRVDVGTPTRPTPPVGGTAPSAAPTTTP